MGIEMRNIPVVVAGFMFILMGTVGIIAFSSFPMDPSFRLISILVPLAPVGIGILLVIGGVFGKPIETMVPTPQPTVVREVVNVKVRCQYCSGLYDETLNQCPNCGAKR